MRATSNMGVVFFCGIGNCVSMVVGLRRIAKRFTQADTPVSAFYMVHFMGEGNRIADAHMDLAEKYSK